MEWQNKQFVQAVYLAPIWNDFLLGSDVTKEKDIKVNTKKGIQTNGKTFPCNVDRVSDKTTNVNIARSVTIPATCEFVMYSSCNEIIAGCIDLTYLCQASEEASRKVLIARTVITTTFNKVPVKIINSKAVQSTPKKGLGKGNYNQQER